MANPTVDPSWLPHTLGGWLAVFVSLFAISGAGSFAAIWRFLLQPLRHEIEERAKTLRAAIEKEEGERRQADKEEHDERKHEYELLTHNEYGVLSRHKQSLKTDIDNVGTKYNQLEAAATDREARVRDLGDRMRDTEHDVKSVHEKVGTLAADVGTFREEQNQMRVDIIAHIQGAKKETLGAIERATDRIGEVEKQVAVIDDRQRRREGDEQK